MTRLYAANLAYTTLDAPINASQISFTVTDPTNFPDEGMFIVRVGSEIMLVQEIDKMDFEFKEVIRGYEGTTPSAHDAESVIANRLTAGYLNAMHQSIEDKLDAPAGVVDGSLLIKEDFVVTHTTGEGEGEEVAFVFEIIGDEVFFGKAVDLQYNTLKRPVIEHYGETHVDLGNIAGELTLDLSLGNIFFGKVTGNITGVDIINASEVHTNSLTLELLADDEHTISWFLPHPIALGQTGISASDVDNSFNITGGTFDEDLKPGDIINVSGFAEEGNNKSFRVKSATTTKIVVADDVVTESAGATVSIARRTEFFTDAEVPEAPTPFIKKVYAFWSYGDPTRWNISVVGDF